LLTRLPHLGGGFCFARGTGPAPSVAPFVVASAALAWLRAANHVPNSEVL
jgi:hypothetical protein